MRLKRLPYLQRFQREGVGVFFQADTAELGEQVRKAGEGDGGWVRADLGDDGKSGFPVCVLIGGGNDAGDGGVRDAAACGALCGQERALRGRQVAACTGV